MTLSLTTSNRQASESLTDGLRAIARYYEHRQIGDIEKASDCIDAALERDGDYGLAIYYKGVVLDLIGRPADAPQYFERILSESDEPKLRMETLFNLGVVYYHRYSQEFLQGAKSYFDRVIEDTEDEQLKHLATAHLAQTHAMWMRPSHAQLPDKRKPISQDLDLFINEHFNECQCNVGRLREVENKEPRVEATYQNASGMANMYYTDHVARDIEPRRGHLEAARDALLAADALMPNDWANNCDIGSLELRLAVLARDTDGDAVDEHLSRARQRLWHVVERLRPGYGFALYELGIVHRVWAKWGEADSFLNAAAEVPIRYRDVDDEQVKEQRDRVKDRDPSYP
jgi:tetratricopeptide (TPR) repeat protein